MKVEVQDLVWEAAAKKILKGISLAVQPGTFVGVIGPNGSGKSSLLRCIYRLYRPESGVVCLNGTDVWELSAKEHARQTAVVLQESGQDFGLTVREVVLMGRTPHKGLFASDTQKDWDLVEESLRQVDMYEFWDRPLSQLSGGEKQRVMIARALVQQPQLLILDEPTNHLDVRHQFEVLELCADLGITVMASLHDLNLAASYTEYLYLLKDGQVLVEGTPEEVLTPQWIQAVFGVDATVIWNGKTGRLSISMTPINSALTTENQCDILSQSA